MSQYRVFLKKKDGWQMLPGVVPQQQKKQRAEAVREEGFKGEIAFRRAPKNPVNQRHIPLPDHRGLYPNPW